MASTALTTIRAPKVPASQWWRQWALAPIRRIAKALGLRAYEAATTGRASYGWNAGAQGPNIEVGAALVTLRQRSRDLARNNSLAGRVLTVLPAALIGEGIRPQPQTGDADLDARLLDLWSSWGLDADASGRHDVYGLQLAAVRGWLESGESLLRRRWRRPEDGLRLPVQVQLLEGDFIVDTTPTFRSDPMAQSLQYGIEVDAIGRRTAYHLYRRHPGEAYATTSQESVMVPASEVSHVYQATRPGQLRGVPWLASVMLDLRDLDDVEHAEIVRLKMQACLTAFRRSASLDPVGLSDQVEQDDDGRWLETLSPGMIAKLPAGEEIDFLAPQQFGGFADAVRHYQRVIAVGSQVPYELLTGDLSGVNYSSIRAGDLEYRRLVSVLRRTVVVPHVCQPLWRWMVEAAQLAGRLPMLSGETMARALHPAWHPPRWVAIDREAEVKADILEMQAGVRTVAQAAAERGQDWRALLAQLSAERDEAEALGLTLSAFGGMSPSQAVTMPDGVASVPAADAA